MEAAKMGFTVIPTVCPMAGTTSPYSLDGTLLQGNIENIFLAAITQMVNPGNPFLYAFGPSISDMHTGHDMYYTVEKVLWKIATTEIAKAYNMPSSAESGGTLGAGYDMQSGAESMLFMLTAQNPGADILAGIGSCYNANGLSSEMIVMQSEWFEMASYLSKGIDTENMEKSLVSLTEQGPGGNFLMDDTTIKNLRSSEFYSPCTLDMSGGYRDAPSMLQNAHERVIELTRNYESPVPKSIQEDISRFFGRIYNS
jgi:trimethylamine--corrinoid protein Co-methyltransferase